MLCFSSPTKSRPSFCEPVAQSPNLAAWLSDQPQLLRWLSHLSSRVRRLTGADLKAVVCRVFCRNSGTFHDSFIDTVLRSEDTIS